MERSSYRKWLAVAAASYVQILSALYYEAVAQTPPPAQQPSAPIPILGVSPNTGGSTLDRLRPSKSDSVELQFPSGFTCRTGGGDVPALVFYGDSGELVTPVTGIGGLRAGMAVIVPLYRPKRAMCDRAMQLQDAISTIELAEKLVTSGAMTNDEFMELSRRVKRQALGISGQNGK